MLTKYSISDIIISNSKKTLLMLGHLNEPKIQMLIAHRHDFYSKVWFTGGSGVNVIDFDEYKMQSNRLFLMKPEQIHNWSYSNETRGYILVFDKYLIKNFLPGLLSSVYFDLSSNIAVFVKILFDNSILESRNKDKISGRFVNAGINFLLLKLTRLISQSEHKQTIKSEEILGFSKLISETISENVPVTEYASMLSITIEKLNGICKLYYGQGPKAIILDKRLIETKRLLYFTALNGTFALKEVLKERENKE